MKFLLTASALMALLVFVGHGIAEDPKVPAKLVPEPRTLDLGEVWGRSNFHWQVKVANPCSRGIEVEELRTACTCIETDPRSFFVPPGATKVIDVVLDLRDNGVRLSADDTTHPYSSFSATIKPDYAGVETTSSDTWYVTGKIRHPFIGVPRVWDIGSILCDSSEPPTATLPIVCASGVSLSSVHCDKKWGTATVATDRSGNSNVLLNLHDRPLGPFEFPLQLSAETNEGNELPPLSVKVTGNVVGDVEVYPKEVALGLLRPGQTSENIVFIRSRTGQAVHVNHVACSDKQIVVVPPHDQGNEKTDALAFAIKSTSGKQPGHYSRIVEFDVHTQDQAPVTVSFRLTYTVCENSL